jgi:hypothetical protein
MEPVVQPKTRDWLIDELEKAFIWAGASDFESGITTLKKVIDKLQDCHDTLRTKEHLAQQLNTLPEPSWVQKRFIQGFFRYLPQVFRFGVKQLAQVTEDEIPGLPAGRPGPDALLKEQIVAEVSKRQMHGCNLKQAKERTARHFHTSFSTVQRIWDDRGNPGEVDFRSVLRYLNDGGNMLE